MNYQAELIKIFGLNAIEAAKAHAQEQFPRESCGFIVGETYVPCANEAADPFKNFIIADARYDNAVIGRSLRAIVHSHPGGPIFPTELDMRQQLATNVPWLLISLNEKAISDIVAWGDGLPTAPIIGRPFVHGVFDCYSCVRDVYGLGQDELKKQGVKWPLPPIVLPNVPRNDEWWKSDQDLYVEHFEQFGFKKINSKEAQAGDACMMAIGTGETNPKKRICHAGVLTGDDFILHHLPRRPSRRDPAGMWIKHVDLWVRYAP